MKVDEWTSEDVHTSGGGEFPPCAGDTLFRTDESRMCS